MGTVFYMIERSLILYVGVGLRTTRWERLHFRRKFPDIAAFSRRDVEDAVPYVFHTESPFPKGNGLFQTVEEPDFSQTP